MTLDLNIYIWTKSTYKYTDKIPAKDNLVFLIGYYGGCLKPAYAATEKVSGLDIPSLVIPAKNFKIK